MKYILATLLIVLMFGLNTSPLYSQDSGDLIDGKKPTSWIPQQDASDHKYYNRDNDDDGSDDDDGDDNYRGENDDNRDNDDDDDANTDNVSDDLD